MRMLIRVFSNFLVFVATTVVFTKAEINTVTLKLSRRVPFLRVLSESKPSKSELKFYSVMMSLAVLLSGQ